MATRGATAFAEGSDYSKAINELYSRLYKLEQMTTSPSVMGSIGTDPTVHSITIDDGVNPPRIIDLEVGAPSNLVLATNTFFNEIYVDADWDPPVAIANISGYEVQYRKRLTLTPTWDIPTIIYAPGSSLRIRNLEPNQTYEVKVWAINTAGVRGSTVLTQTIATVADLVAPPAVTGVTLARGATSAIVYYTPLTSTQAPDVANGNGLYRVELHTNSSFTALYRVQITSASVVQFGDITTSQTLWARVAAIDTSENQGAWADAGGSSTIGGVIESMVVGTLTGALITVGTLNGDRIVGNTVIANKLTASTLTSGRITLSGGGEFWAGSGTTGVLINSSGITLLQSGTPTVSLDATTGNASFKGTVTASTITGSTITGGLLRTASSGQRVEITSGLANTISFYSGSGSEIAEGQIFVGVIGSSVDLTIRSPTWTGQGNVPNILFKSSASGPYMELNSTNGGGGQMFFMSGDYYMQDGHLDVDSYIKVGAAGGGFYQIYFGARGGADDWLQFDDTNNQYTFVADSGAVCYVRTKKFISEDGVYYYSGSSLSSDYDQYFSGAGQLEHHTATGSNYMDTFKDVCVRNSEATPSSFTLKKNIGDITYGLAEIMQLRPVRFQHKASYRKLKGYERSPYELGFIAEEVGEIFPENIFEETERRPLSLNYAGIIAPLVKAVQELAERVQRLESNAV